MSRTDPVDDLVRRIMLTRERQEPDEDPGDITIQIQDDMDFVEVIQRDEVIGIGSTVYAALYQAFENVTKQRVP